MKLPPYVRRQLLADHGFAFWEIEACATKAPVARKKRKQTIDSYDINPKLDERIECLCRALTSPFRLKKMLLLEKETVGGSESKFTTLNASDLIVTI